MKLVDSNLLIYAVNEDDPHHAVAFRWLEDALNGSETLGFAWAVLLGYLRVATGRVALPTPLTPARAFAHMSTWLGAPNARVVHPNLGHAEVLEVLLQESGTAGNLVVDAHLAALALQSGATIVSFDRDFGRFAGVTVEVPGR